MDILRKDNPKSKWFLMGFLIILWFLWFQLRPSLIRTHCQNTAWDLANDYFNSTPLEGIETSQKSLMQIQYMDGAYERCLHDNGLE